MSRVTDIVDYYTNLLIIQYNNKPKARATIDLLVSELLADDIYTDVLNGYDIDTAVGVQLDVIGKYANIDRFYYDYTITGEYFGFADAVDTGAVSANIVGFDDAASPDKDGNFLSSTDVVSDELILNDDAYRLLIKLRIIQNHSTHDTQSITSSLAMFFGDDIVMTDNYDMTISYFIGNTASELIQAAIQKDVLPRPAGVGSQVIRGNSFFGFADADNLDAIGDYVVGFNDATTGFIKDGRFLDANNDIL